MRELDIDTDRMLADLDRLRDFGRSGTGVVRRAFSEADIASRRWLAGRMAEAGLAVHWDPAANVFGLPPGDEPCLLVGSHSDTQVTGGWLDGAWGVIVGLEIARAAREQGLRIACVSLQDEESRFGHYTGSATWTGLRTLAEVDEWRDWDGVRLGDLRPAVPECAAGSFLPLSRFAAWLEPHIEQGPVLDTAGERVGVVEAIVGCRDLGLRFEGTQNHAGTTPMRLRRDALRGAVDFAQRLDGALAPLIGPATVWTIGRVVVTPNARSIVPGAAEINVQWRDASAERLGAMLGAVRALAAEVAAAHGLGLAETSFDATDPVTMDAAMVADLAAAAAALAPEAWRRMPSGALHDANILAPHMPAAMVFAPSIGGISHNFAEDTHRGDLALAARVAGRAAGHMAARL